MAATIYAVGFSIYNLDLREYWTLARQGKEIVGVVSGKNAETHNLIKYEYQVGSNTFTGGGYSGDIDKDFSQVGIGEKVKVFYSPDNPSFSSIGNPKSLFYSNLRMSIFLSLMPSLVVLGFKLKTELTKQKAQSH